MSSTKASQPALRNLAAGDVLFREGEVGDFAYQVVKGKIEVCKFNGDEYVTLSILEKGALFGEMALIDKQPRSAMARATQEAVVKEIDIVHKNDAIKRLNLDNLITIFSGVKEGYNENEVVELIKQKMK